MDIIVLFSNKPRFLFVLAGKPFRFFIQLPRDLFVDHIKQLENPIGCLECQPYRRSTNIVIDAKSAKAPLTRRVAYSCSLMCIFTRLVAVNSAHCLLTCISEMQTTWFASLASESGSVCLSTYILLFLICTLVLSLSQSEISRTIIQSPWGNQSMSGSSRL